MASENPRPNSQSIPLTFEASTSDDWSDDGSDGLSKSKGKPKIMRLFPLKPASRSLERNSSMKNDFCSEFERRQRTDDRSQVLTRDVMTHDAGEVPVAEQERRSAPLSEGVPQNSVYRLRPEQCNLELSLQLNLSPVPTPAFIDLVPRRQSTCNLWADPLEPNAPESVHSGLEIAEKLKGLRSRSVRTYHGASSPVAGQSRDTVSGSSRRKSAKKTLSSMLNPAQSQPSTGEQLTPLARRTLRPSTYTRHGPRQRSSTFKGVTHYKRTGRWEAHIWNERKQIYLGASSTAERAARAYDRAVIHFRKVGAELNFPLEDYQAELRQLMEISEVELVRMLRKQSAGESAPFPEYPPTTHAQQSAHVGESELFVGFGGRGEVTHEDADHFGAVTSSAAQSNMSSEPEGESTLHAPEAAHVSKRRTQYLDLMDHIRI